MVTHRAIRFEVESRGEVSALLERPGNARQLLVLAHGAGAGMTHPFLESLSTELASVGVATLRYQFPYMEQRRRIPRGSGVGCVHRDRSRINTGDCRCGDLSVRGAAKWAG